MSDSNEAPAGTAASSRSEATAAAGARGLFAKLRAHLLGGSVLTRDLGELFSGGRIDPAAFETLEARLLSADVGVAATTRILADLRKGAGRAELGSLAALTAALEAALTALLQPVARPLVIDAAVRPFVVLVVGVNGSGKTTTIGKLAQRLGAQGRKVMLAAGDTFRAAAVEQLSVWGERAGVPVIAQAAGADPAAVVFDAFAAARARGMDVLLADTAGRLHNQAHLMDELRKVKRVLARLDASAPHEVLLVLDASQGQNALAQARVFHEAVGVTGIVLTKLDGTAKGGIVLAIAAELGLPLRYVGVGEGLADLGEFEPADFVASLLAVAP